MTIHDIALGIMLFLPFAAVALIIVAAHIYKPRNRSAAKRQAAPPEAAAHSMHEPETNPDRRPNHARLAGEGRRSAASRPRAGAQSGRASANAMFVALGACAAADFC